MVVQKGPDLLLEAVPFIHKFRGDAKFVFVGDGHMLDSLKGRAAHLGVTHAGRVQHFLTVTMHVSAVRCLDGAYPSCVPVPLSHSAFRFYDVFPPPFCRSSLRWKDGRRGFACIVQIL